MIQSDQRDIRLVTLSNLDRWHSFCKSSYQSNPILDKWLWLAWEEPGRVEICLKRKLPKQIKNMSSAHSSGSRANQRELAARL